MGISLQKGGNISLTKAEPGLEKIIVGLGWDARSTDGAAFDLDASIFMVTAAGKVRSDYDFIFYNNRVSTDGSVEHLGDNLTGVGEGDDEVVRIDLMKVPAEITRLVFAVSIYEAEARRQNFGMVASAFIRILNNATRGEISRYDLSEDASLETSMIFGEVYRHGAEWKFKAVGQGFRGGFVELIRTFGVNV
ncbi:MAG: TerD family protein [Blastocatellia bacterium]|nr:TerD family protein [Blastocatellia bacterium]MBN8725123.1 TerD family protein [Acidobacteriota bacterium]